MTVSLSPDGSIVGTPGECERSYWEVGTGKPIDWSADPCRANQKSLA